MESGFCKESPAHLFLNFSCLLELTDSLCTLTEEADRRKLPQVQVSVEQEVKSFLSLHLKQEDFSMNVTIENWKRVFLSPLLYCLSFPLPIPIPSCIKWYFSVYS